MRIPDTLPDAVTRGLEIRHGSHEGRPRKRAEGVSPLHATSETVLSPAVVQTVVEESTKLNDGLKAQLAEVESAGQALH
jgi:hypothetical protein